MNQTSILRRFINRAKREAIRRKGYSDLRAMSRMVRENAMVSDKQPIIFFDASTRLNGLSLNAGFAILSAWTLTLQGVPVVHFVCSAGLKPCLLGTSRKDAHAAPPCAGCLRQSEATFSNSEVSEFDYKPNADLDKKLDSLGLPQLMKFEYLGTPLGELVLPSIRWILRRHHLLDDQYTRDLFKNYLKSAWSLAGQFEKLLDESRPQALVVFNGMQYPEATARWLARRRGIRVVSHEVGMQPLSAYFTDGDATAYDLDIPKDFQLDPAQNEKLDAYLTARFKGDFHMAGVQFWPEMSQLSPEFLQLAKEFKQVVPVFTNVIFDTSQPHANVIFEDMFTWLDDILSVAKDHPETLFVIRAHPDEARVGKASEESVAEWAQKRQLEIVPNLRFIPPQEFINSYDLIRMAKFVLIYNSTIGMEASILGAGVLSAGKARYTASDVVWFPQDKPAYFAQLEDLLQADHVEVPPHFKANARRFLFWQLYRSSLSFEEFLEPDGVWAGYVKLKEFEWQNLLPVNSETMAVLSNGLLQNGDFMLMEDRK
jgi:hypothetical protein